MTHWRPCGRRKMLHRCCTIEFGFRRGDGKVQSAMGMDRTLVMSKHTHDHT